MINITIDICVRHKSGILLDEVKRHLEELYFKGRIRRIFLSKGYSKSQRWESSMFREYTHNVPNKGYCYPERVL